LETLQGGEPPDQLQCEDFARISVHNFLGHQVIKRGLG
jgi:hypothetical protein